MNATMTVMRSYAEDNRPILHLSWMRGREMRYAMWDLSYVPREQVTCRLVWPWIENAALTVALDMR